MGTRAKNRLTLQPGPSQTYTAVRRMIRITSSGLQKPPTVLAQDVSIKPDSQLTPEERAKFRQLHSKYVNVFNPAKYNGFSGKMEAVVNMGPVLPKQQKGRIPQYSKDRLVELQQKFDKDSERF